MTICRQSFSKYLVVTNMLNLQQVYYSHTSFASLNWKSTENNKVNSDKIAFIRINQKSQDLYNRRSVGSSSTLVFNEKYNNPKFFDRFQSTLRQVGKKIYGMFTDYLSIVHFMEKQNSYMVTQISLATGNLLAFYLQVQFMEGLNMTDPGENAAHTEFPEVPNTSHNIRFSINGSQDMKQTALANANLRVLSFSNQDYLYKGNKSNFNNLNLPNEEPLTYTFMVYLPNYHSYIVRYTNYFHKCSISLFKLYNPFASFENDYTQTKPECRQWACILIFKSKEDQYFVILYDMKHEWIKMQQEPNFKKIFNKTLIEKNLTCDHDASSISFNIDLIGEEYTIYPLHIMRVENLQLIKLERGYMKDSDPDEMSATLFYQNTTSAQLIVNRNLKVTMKNLYVSSNYIDARINELYGVNLRLKLIVLPFYEYDYYKYYLFMVVCLAAAFVYKACAYFSLKKQENDRLKDFEQEFERDESHKHHRRITRKKELQELAARIEQEAQPENTSPEHA